MKKNKKSMMETTQMSNAVRIDRDAFKRGVEDVMTLAPLRDAVRSAAHSVLSKNSNAGRTKETTGSSEKRSDDRNVTAKSR
jgi:hypothetical protein